MRDILEAMRDALVERTAHWDKNLALYTHDSVTAIIDKASEACPVQVIVEPSVAPVMEVASVQRIRDMLNECLSAALTPLPKTKRGKPRRDTANRNKKARVKARTAQRRLKKGKQ